MIAHSAGPWCTPERLARTVAQVPSVAMARLHASVGTALDGLDPEAVVRERRCTCGSGGHPRHCAELSEEELP